MKDCLAEFSMVDTGAPVEIVPGAYTVPDAIYGNILEGQMPPYADAT